MTATDQQGRRGVCVVGAAGRMGRRVVRLLGEHHHLELRSALERADSGAAEGADAGEVAGVGCLDVPIVTDPAAAVVGVDVVVDFTAPATAALMAPLCAERTIPYLVASTALSSADEQALSTAAERTAVMQAANLSTGINALLELVELAARRLGVDFDVEVSEIHHRYKRDAPSGTALALGAAAQVGRGALQEVLGRSGATDPRDANQLGYAAVRGGDVAGEHTVYFLADGERLELTHRSSSADIFAAGALRAADWLIGRPPARYAMRDVLGDG